MNRTGLGWTAPVAESVTGTGTGTKGIARGQVGYFTDALLQKLKRTPGPLKLAESAAPRGVRKCGKTSPRSRSGAAEEVEAFDRRGKCPDGGSGNGHPYLGRLSDT
jgi:hypothetical protein